MLFYSDILNYSRIKEKYGISVAKILLKRISEIIISKVRTSDIVGIYREGTFLVYFCNLDISDAKIKIEKICNNIYNDEKIKQIGINIELKNSIVSVEKDIQDFDDLLLKCLKSDKK
jgi:GGDEF domain-containing protein